MRPAVDTLRMSQVPRRSMEPSGQALVRYPLRIAYNVKHTVNGRLT